MVQKIKTLTPEEQRKRYHTYGVICGIIFFLMLFVGRFLFRIFVDKLDLKGQTGLILGTVYFGILLVVGVLLVYFMVKGNEYATVQKTAKSRTKACVISLIPGAGHIYLRKYSMIPIFLFMYAIFGYTIYLTFFTGNWCLGLIATMIMVPLFMLLFGEIDVDYQCTLLHLPYTNNLDSKPKKYSTAYNILFLVAFGLLIIIVLVNMVALPTEPLGITDAIIVGCWALFTLLGLIWVRIFRNKIPSELSDCQILYPYDDTFQPSESKTDSEYKRKSPP